MNMRMDGPARPDDDCIPFDGQRLLGLDRMGLTATGMRFEGRVWLVWCEPAEGVCPACGSAGFVRSSRLRRVVHAPSGPHAVHLVVRVRTRQCRSCPRRWTEGPGCGRLDGAAVDWALAGLVLDKRSVSSLARGLGCSWNTVNTAVLGRVRGLTDGDPARLDGVSALGVDEHVWRHTAFGPRYVTVIVDLTPVASGGPARLLDMVEGRGAKAFAGWLEARTGKWRRAIRVVAMDAFEGYKRAAARLLPGARVTLDPFHVVHLAAGRVDRVRCRLQTASTGRRGTKDDPLYRARRPLLKAAASRTERQAARVAPLLADPANQDLKATEGAYQKIVSCYRADDRRKGRGMMAELIESSSAPGATGCPELGSLGRTMRRRERDILAAFDAPHLSNGPTEAVNGRIEHLRGIALGFTSFDDYRLRSLAHSGQLQHALQHLL